MLSGYYLPGPLLPKGDGQLRLCGDYKVTINLELEIAQYPLPKLEDIFATLAEEVFLKIDPTHAYQQMRLAPEFRDLVTINTHKRLYHYPRLPSGVASALALFQREMEMIMQGLPKVAWYSDNILIIRATVEEHMETLVQVLQRLQAYGIRAKRTKCALLCDAVEYLGYRIDAMGMHTLPSKVEAVTQAPELQDLAELVFFSDSSITMANSCQAYLQFYTLLKIYTKLTLNGCGQSSVQKHLTVLNSS